MIESNKFLYKQQRFVGMASHTFKNCIQIAVGVFLYE